MCFLTCYLKFTDRCPGLVLLHKAPSIIVNVVPYTSSQDDETLRLFDRKVGLGSECLVCCDGARKDYLNSILSDEGKRYQLPLRLLLSSLTPDCQIPCLSLFRVTLLSMVPPPTASPSPSLALSLPSVSSPPLPPPPLPSPPSPSMPPCSRPSSARSSSIPIPPPPLLPSLPSRCTKAPAAHHGG